MDELGRNGLLAGSVGVLVGGALVGRVGGGGGSHSSDVRKPQKMAGIVREAATAAAG